MTLSNSAAHVVAFAAAIRKAANAELSARTLMRDSFATLLTAMDSAELADWKAYERLHGLPQDRYDLWQAQIQSLIYGAWYDTKQHPRSLESFLLGRPEREPAGQNVETQQAIMQTSQQALTNNGFGG